MPSIFTDEGLWYTATIHGKREFKVDVNDKQATSYILADNAFNLEFEVGCFEDDATAAAPPLLFELYVDGVLRNVVKPHTGRGLAYKQIAGLKIDRGLVMTEDGVVQMQHFRFYDLDIDDAILHSRVVREAGCVEINIVHEKLRSEISQMEILQLPEGQNDHSTISIYEGEVNNTIGVRFDQKKGGLADTKYIKLRESARLMFSREQCEGRHVLASFKFIYGSQDLLNHLGAIPEDDKLFDKDLELRRNLPSDTYDSDEPAEDFVDIIPRPTTPPNKRTITEYPSPPESAKSVASRRALSK